MSNRFDSAEEAAEYFALQYWEKRQFTSSAPCHPIWSQVNGDQAVVVLGVTSTHPYAPVLCNRNGEGWLATAWMCGLGEMRCECPKPISTPVRVFCWKTIEPAVSRVRIAYQGQETLAEPIDGCVYFAEWSTTEQKMNWQAGEFCVYIDNRLVWDAAVQKTWMYKYLATVGDFANSYERWYRLKRDEDFWSCDLFFDCRSRDEKLDAVRCLIQATIDVVKQQDYLYYIGAGPLEDLMSDWLLDRITAETTEPGMYVALAGVFVDDDSPELEARLAHLIRQNAPKTVRVVKGEAGSLNAQRIGRPRLTKKGK